MIGKLTQKLENVTFEKRHPLLWGALHTYAKSEKAVQLFLESRGIESYLPMITLYENGLKTKPVVQTPGYIYACWDCHRHPGLCTHRNKIYRELILNSVEIVNDVRLVCLSDNKMTEKERMEVVFGIRPKLKAMNKKLQRLTKAVKYTSLSDVWAEIDYGARPAADKKSVAQQCIARWKRNGKRY